MNNVITRKMATLRTINAIRPIENADAIEAVKIDGWQVVVKKGEFQAGDSCIYFEIDSFLPEMDERFAFLRKNGTRTMGERKGMVLKTIKLRGTLSQGLALPVADFQAEIKEHQQTGKDLDSLIGILKWEPPIPASLGGDVAGAMPSFIQKTDQERIQNLEQDTIDEILKEPILMGEVKLDGTSMTVYCSDGERAHVCGRNWQFKDDNKNSLVSEAKRLGLFESLPRLCRQQQRQLALQGELIGEGINQNNEKLIGQQWVIFDIFDISQQIYVSDTEKLAIVEQLFGTQPPKILGDVTQHHERLVPYMTIVPTSKTKDDFIKEMLKLAEQGNSRNPARRREGLVIKSQNRQFSFKSISNVYLLKMDAKEEKSEKPRLKIS